MLPFIISRSVQFVSIVGSMRLSECMVYSILSISVEIGIKSQLITGYKISFTTNYENMLRVKTYGVAESFTIAQFNQEFVS